MYSGIQQTGAGGTDRPDQVAQLHFSTGRTVREDYLLLGADNPTFFHIAINVPGGAGRIMGVSALWAAIRFEARATRILISR